MKRDRCFNIFFVIFNILFWGYLYFQLVVIKNTGDYEAHNYFARLMMNGDFETTYPGYQWLVGIPYKLTGVKIEYISVIVLTIFALLSVYATKLLLIELLKEQEFRDVHISILSFILNIIQPIFTYSIRPGYSSGNGYISPTQAVCKPFIILAFLYTYRMYKDNSYTMKNQVKLTVSLILSCIMKPLFAMTYVPAMGILYLFIEIKNKDIIKNKIINYVSKSYPLLITGIILILQYVLSFHLKITEIEYGYSMKGGATIKFGFLVAWRLVVSNVPLSIIFAYFFPIVLFLSIIIIRIKTGNTVINDVEKKFLTLCLFYGAISLFYMCFFHQGKEETACDFRNAWIVTFSIIYILCSIILYRITFGKKNNNKTLAINWLAYIVHILMGMALYARNIM